MENAGFRIFKKLIVLGNKHDVPMFLAGEGAEKFKTAFSQYGMKLTVLNAEAGGASAIKMFKSVVMKGLPQLMFESFDTAYISRQFNQW